MTKVLGKLQKLPLGQQSFKLLRKDNCLYIDKTKHIYDLIDTGNAYFLARPRRFGKSLLCSTIKHLFRGDRELFKGLWIDQSDWQWDKYPVIHISMAQLQHTSVDQLTTSVTRAFLLIAHEYGVTIDPGVPGQMFNDLILALAPIGKVVIIIDEYDKPMINQLHDLTELEKFRLFFKQFYGSLKDLGEHLRFLFITGVSQFSLVSIFSDLNHLDQISLTEQAATICGYTQQELETACKPYFERAEQLLGIPYQELLATTKAWYNGYCFAKPSPRVERVYNPFSILKFCKHADFENYWFATGTPSFVLPLLNNYEFAITDFEKVTATSGRLTALNPAEPNLTTLLYQTGYLTIQSYDRDSEMFTLGFPNHEVARSCSEQLFIHTTKLSENVLHNVCTELKKAFVTNQLDNLKAILANYFAQIPYTIAPLEERGYQGLFYIMVFALKLNIVVEEATSIGRIDAVITTAKNIFILEFKIRGTAEQALQQIKDRRYAEKYSYQNLPIVLIGILFDPETRTVTEVLSENYSD